MSSPTKTTQRLYYGSRNAYRNKLARKRELARLEIYRRTKVVN